MESVFILIYFVYSFNFICFSPSFLPSFFPSPAQPLLSSQELEKTKAIVNEFGREGGAGEKLQQALLEKTNSNDSWVGAGREGVGGG